MGGQRNICKALEKTLDESNLFYHLLLSIKQQQTIRHINKVGFFVSHENIDLMLEKNRYKINTKRPDFCTLESRIIVHARNMYFDEISTMHGLIRDMHEQLLNFFGGIFGMICPF